MGISVKDVNQHEFVKAFAEFLKKSGKVKLPEWSDVVKLGIYKELAPYSDDWFYIRTASVARHLYIRAPAGVKSFAKIYGGRKNNGTCPSHFCGGSRSVARKALQVLEQLKLVEKDANGGRRLSQQGQRDLDRIAAQIAAKNRPPAPAK